MFHIFKTRIYTVDTGINRVSYLSRARAVRAAESVTERDPRRLVTVTATYGEASDCADYFATALA